jgi:hypothetical protein
MSIAIPSLRAAIAVPSWTKNELWRKAHATPSLDLRFADSRSLVDATSGENLVTFTRASSGTYVGSDGLIKTATTNLVTYSQDFDQWSATNATVTPNAELAPDGTTTADQVTSTASDPWVQRSVTTASAGAYTFSVYIKAATGVSSNVVALRVFDSDGTIYGSTSISVTTEWQRYQISVTTAKPVTIVRVDAPNFATIGDVFYLWGAQLEQSSTVGEYIKTTSTINSAPRFDHDPETGESLGLLVEESRTNLLLQSNGFDTTWTESSSSITAASGTAPDGTNTAWELKDTVDGGPTPHAIVQSYTGWTSGTTYTFSCWMKAGTLTEGGFIFTSAVFGAVLNARFNLTTGALISASTGVTASSVLYPNGWVRVIATATATATDTGNFSIRIMDGSTSYQGDGTGTILIWGAQLEAGSFPTSYIPTTSSTVTRAADVASISGSNFSSWYRQDESSAFVDFTLNGVNTGNNFVYDFSDGTINEEIFLNYQDSGNARWVARVASVQVTQDQSGAGLPRVKHAFGMASNNYMAARDGILSTGSSQVGMPSITSLSLGVRFTNVAHSNGTIRRLTYWPQRLGNEVLQTITQ